MAKWISLTVAALFFLSTCLTGCGKTQTQQIETQAQSSQSNSDQMDPADTSYGGLFKKDHIVDINVTISEDDFNEMLENPLDKTYYRTTVDIDGDTVENVGICTKGNLTLKSLANNDSNRYSFGFQFDKYIEDQTYNGIASFCVNNGYADPSFLREYLAYEILNNLGSPTPLCSFAKLSVNGEFYGLYKMVERTDTHFTERIFGTTDVLNHYEAETGSTLASEESLKNFNLLSGNDEEFNELKTLVNTLSELNEENYKEIENILDVDSVLQYIAGNVACGSYDSYLSMKSQNYEFVQYNGKLYMIPWDYNMAFGGYPSDQGKSRTISIDNPCLDGSVEQLPLLKLISYPEYRQRYENYLKQAVAYLETIEDRINNLSSMIRPYVYDDPTKLYTNEDFEEELVYKELSTNSEANGQQGKQPIENLPALPDEALQQNGNLPLHDNQQKMGPPDGNPPEFGSMPPNGDAHGFGGSGQLMKPRIGIMTYAVDILNSLKSQLHISE